MTKAELIKLIENGNDIMFSVAGKNYTILTWTDQGIGIDEQNPHDTQLQYFTTAEALVNHFEIGESPLGNLSDQIVITDYT